METLADPILVVEDDSANRFMLALTLKQSGYRVETAATAAHALDLLKRERFASMITDGRMEPMDGLALSRLAKQIQPDLRIVMVSAVYTDKDIQGFPIDAIFPKPVPSEALIGWLSR